MTKWLRDWLKTRDWRALYEYVKTTGNLESDQQLANAMGVGKNLISDFKNGRKALTWKAQLRLLDLAGYTHARDIIAAMLPTETKKTATRGVKLVAEEGASARCEIPLHGVSKIGEK
ncbi:TPA: hypothetical protein QDB23_001671 [Burkholderia vietnamiensis]|nr:hypothetical protein [Burkholderia vietnamiensis]